MVFVCTVRIDTATINLFLSYTAMISTHEMSEDDI